MLPTKRNTWITRAVLLGGLVLSVSFGILHPIDWNSSPAAITLTPAGQNLLMDIGESIVVGLVSLGWLALKASVLVVGLFLLVRFIKVAWSD